MGTNEIITKQKRFPIWVIIAAVVVLIGIAAAVIAVAGSGKERKVTKQLELARKYVLEMNYEQAVIAYKTAIKIDPKNVEAYIELADVYVDMGNVDKAEEVLAAAAENVDKADAEKVSRKQEEVEKAREKEEQVSVTPKPTKEPTPQPTEAPTPTPTPEPTPTSEPSPTTEPTVSPTSEPTATMTTTPEPTATPTPTVEPIPTLEPTPTLLPTPTPELIATPTLELTATPIPAPTAKPTPTPTPTLTPTSTPTPTPSPTPAPTSGARLNDDIQKAGKGEIIRFGSYEQDNITSNGKEPIEWIVLSNNGSELFVVSKYSLDWKSYNEEWTNITWENCTLRKWLNNEFLNAAFSSSEQSLIKTVTLKNNANPYYGTYGGNDTKDKVFLLSLDDMVNTEYGFSSDYKEYDVARRCAATDYAIAQGAQLYIDDNSDWYFTSDGKPTSVWWLRSPGTHSTEAAYVEFYGLAERFGSGVHSSAAIRPAIVLNLNP